MNEVTFTFFLGGNSVCGQEDKPDSCLNCDKLTSCVMDVFYEALEKGSRPVGIVSWTESIRDNNLHHIGEYFTYISNKPWSKKNSGLTKPFRDWFIQQNHEEIGKSISDKFETTRDWDGTYFIRRK